MPLFGSRMVCETANYKHIEETKKKFAEREESLGEWVKEKSERKAALHELKVMTRRASQSRSRSNSISRSRKNSIVASTLPDSSSQDTQELPPNILTGQSEEDKDSVPKKMEAGKIVNQPSIPNISIEQPPEV